MKLREILTGKDSLVRTITPDASLNDVLQALVRFNIGSLVVCESGGKRVVGIITERDILRTQAHAGSVLEKMFVCDVISSHLITAGPEDSIQHAMELMTTHRVRHLPILEQGQLCGLISIGDIVKAHHDELEVENHFMKSYIQGEGAEVTTIVKISQ